MAAALPDWMMLDRFVFRRDDDASFWDDEAAPWARGTTSQGDSFCVALRIAEPPVISGLYLQWPGGPKEGSSCDIVAAHRNLLLVRLTSSPVEKDESLVHPQDYFLCEGRPPSSPDQPPLQLHQIPICTIPLVFSLAHGRTRTAQRSFDLHTVGILCRGEEFAVAQLGVSRRHPVARVEAELCILRSKVNSSDHCWEVERNLPIMYEGDEWYDLVYWRTDRVIPFDKFLCWVNYSEGGGILFCTVLEERRAISYLRLPIRYKAQGADKNHDINCCVCTTQYGHKLVSINVLPGDHELADPMSLATCFIVTGHTLQTTERGRMEWDKVFVITSDKFWALDDYLPQKPPLFFPLVSMVKPNMLYFLFSEEAKHGIDKVSVVAFDTTTMEVSIFPYITGEEDLKGKDADMVERKSHLLDPFIPSELPRFLGTLHKKRKKTARAKSGKKSLRCFTTSERQDCSRSCM